MSKKTYHQQKKENKKNRYDMNPTEKNQPLEEEVLKAAEAAAEEAAAQAENAETVANEETAEVGEESELDQLRHQVEEQQDKYLRLSAEFDNYRKRTMKEKAELIKNGGEKAISAILPILDDLERAMKAGDAHEEVQAMREGIELIYQKFLKILSQQGVQVIETAGQPFDTDFHEAIALVPAPAEDQKGKILDCVQTGYKLNDKVIRHAKVVVAQ